MRIIVTGLVGQYAFGGVAWDYLQYVAGFHQLGHDVVYLEDTEIWPYDPINNTISADCSYNVRYLGDVMNRLGLGDRWIYRNAADGKTYGASMDCCRDADVFLNVSGCGWPRPEYMAIPKTIFIDSDPMFTQVGLALGMKDVIERIGAHKYHFTFAENIHASDCRVPHGGLRWRTTRQPVVLDWWQPTPATGPAFTTVMNWVSYKPSEYAGETWGQKDGQFLKFIELPQRVAQPFEIAMGRGQGEKRPTEFILSKGWKLVEPDKVLPDPWTYRDYLRNSRGEWSVAKEGYVKSRSGWFSCRSACYLALGRPCVLQDTGWSAHYPTGSGLFAFQTLDEAVAGITAINADYNRHAAGARAVAEEMFDARKVLGKLLEEIA